MKKRFADFEGFLVLIISSSIFLKKTKSVMIIWVSCFCKVRHFGFFLGVSIKQVQHVETVSLILFSLYDEWCVIQTGSQSTLLHLINFTSLVSSFQSHSNMSVISSNLNFPWPNVEKCTDKYCWSFPFDNRWGISKHFCLRPKTAQQWSWLHSTPPDYFCSLIA